MSESSKKEPQKSSNRGQTGITTRLFTKRRLAEYKPDSNEIRRTQYFLTGTAIPNSTIRSLLNVDPANEKKMENPIRRLWKVRESKEDTILTDNDQDDMEKSAESNREKALERMRRRFRATGTLWDHFDMKSTGTTGSSTSHREISQRLLKENKNHRRSTFETIKEAIAKSSEVSKLVNADSYETPTIEMSASQTKKAEKYINVNKQLIFTQDLQTQTSFDINNYINSQESNVLIEGKYTYK